MRIRACMERVGFHLQLNECAMDIGHKNQENYYAIDIGTSKVCTLVGQENKTTDSIEIIAYGLSSSQGLSKGSVVNLEKAKKAIIESVTEAEKALGRKIEKASIGISGNHVFSFNNFGVIKTKNGVVTKEDIQEVLEVAKAVLIPQDREILHLIPQEYRIDEQRCIKNPLGMKGDRLEVIVHIVTVKKSFMKNMINAVEVAGVRVQNITLQPKASSDSVLTNDEKELGVAIVDIGAGTTDIGVWHKGVLVHTEVIPVGGNHFTNDLSVALNISRAQAEKLKRAHGSLLFEKVENRSHLTIVPEGNEKRTREVPVSLVSEILYCRAFELLKTIQRMLDDKYLLKKIPCGIVLTGGGALLREFEELGEYVLKMKVKVGYPVAFEGGKNDMQFPQFATALGLLMNERDWRKNKLAQEFEKFDLLNKLKSSFKKMFQELF